MRIYIAARYDRRVELLNLKERLEAYGHKVTSTWLSGIGERWSRARCATIDVADVLSADTVISITEKPYEQYNSGGRHVELGIAIAMSKRCIIVGYRENVFHHLPQLEFYNNVEEMMKRL